MKQYTVYFTYMGAKTSTKVEAETKEEAEQIAKRRYYSGVGFTAIETK